MFGSLWTKKKPFPSPQHSPSQKNDVFLLQIKRIVEDEELKEELIHELLSKHSHQSRKIHFLSAMEDMKKTYTEHEKLKKAEKIVSVFLQRSSPFRLSDVAEKVDLELKQTNKFVKLNFARKMILQELRSDSEICEFISRHNVQCD